METPSKLFSPLRLRELELRNRVMLSPMCQYSAVEGLVQAWHRRHYAERALGGVGLVVVEATAVQPRGRISPADLGLWTDGQSEAFRPLVDDIHRSGAKVAVQLAHAGRKASSAVPWLGVGSLTPEHGGWPVVSSSAGAFDANSLEAKALDEAEIREVIADFASAARRALRAGFDTVELHAAHGYLIHQFLSPLANHRTDAWGGSRENRFRFAVEVTRAVRSELPSAMPLLIRLSATDWLEGGWTAEESIALLNVLKAEGVDFADVSSGGIAPGAKITVGPGYQVPLAFQIKAGTGLPVGAVGLITDPVQAEAIVADGHADAVLLGRQLLRDPWWPARNAPADRRDIPPQYKRAF